MIENCQKEKEGEGKKIGIEEIVLLLTNQVRTSKSIYI